MKPHPNLRRKARRSREDGYILIVMLLFLTLMAIGLTAVAPAMTQRIRREREIELIHRGKQYAHAIRLFYRKFGRYPVRLEELENTNNIRFLRRRYKDPMTASGEWRLIHYGEAQLNLPNAGPLLPGASSPGSSSTAASASSPFANTFSGSSQPGPGQPSTTASQAGTTQDQGGTAAQTGTATGASADSSQSGQASGQPGQPGTPASQISSPLGGGPTLGGGPVVGVASKSKKQSIKELNKKNHYNEWEFVYDPRLDLTTAQALTAATGQTSLTPGTQTLGAPTVGGPTFGGAASGTQPATPSPGMPGMPGPTAPTQQ
jgi:type II secretory pathway pseudopilin PulG